jgi:DDE domain
VRVAGRWRYVYRAIDQFGQVIDVLVSPRRDAAAARRFFERAIGTTNVTPFEVVTDQAATYPVVLEELLPAAWHRTDRYANNRVEADHGRLKARLGPMRGLKQDRSARIVIAGHALVQNLRRGRYELAVEEPVHRRLAFAFELLAVVDQTFQPTRASLWLRPSVKEAVAAQEQDLDGPQDPDRADEDGEQVEWVPCCSVSRSCRRNVNNAAAFLRRRRSHAGPVAGTSPPVHRGGRPTR